MSKNSRYPALDLGPLPVATINRLLGTELEPGNAHLSQTAHRHMARDHPDDYPICREVLARAIACPTFVGQAPDHSRNFELVLRVGRPDGKVVLVAIGLERNEAGNYSVRTSYLIPQRSLEVRRASGRLKLVIPR